ncbi:epimerase [Paludibacterium yongneupense]|uniref:epimerase n=1 Tax=Paludibacterium yongneupense TaxID=400061 RepID=UPI00040FFDA8|nr:epimerase [Paludibacterium yongneupense]
MNIVIYGASGMVGQGVLRECLNAADVGSVKAVGRSPLAQEHPRLSHYPLPDPGPYPLDCPELTGYDACFFCLGASAAGMGEQDYIDVNYAIPMAAGQVLARLNPGMTFIYVSGAGCDSSERGRTMWARIKGRTENGLSRLPLSAFMFRPGIIQPLDAIRSRTPVYRLLYSLMAPLLPLLRRVFPDAVLTTQQMGRAMLAVARHGASRCVLESRDIRALADGLSQGR